ncbi:Ig-like domain repeat protein [Nocardioides sp. YIM 152588]|uniref:Ig-like domain repeat protein n=1 Tax=Nocardioides sp. YIM 152588 TaxID=3158259 RepID=UPI0032E3ED5D
MKFALPTPARTRAGLAGAAAAGVLVAPLAVLPPGQAASADVPFTCAFGASEFGYDAATVLTAARNAPGEVVLSARMDDMPNTAPEFLDFQDVTFVGTVVASVDGEAATLTGSRKGDFKGGVDVPMPRMAGTATDDARTVSVEIESLSMEVVDLATIGCTADETVTLSVPVAAKTTSKTKATYKKKATIVTTVKAVVGKPKGKVTVVVKKGKKKVASEKVALKKGKATLVLPKKAVKKKGKYAVKATYPGAKFFKKSTSKATFKVS